MATGALQRSTTKLKAWTAKKGSFFHPAKWWTQSSGKETEEQEDHILQRKYTFPEDDPEMEHTVLEE